MLCFWRVFYNRGSVLSLATGSPSRPTHTSFLIMGELKMYVLSPAVVLLLTVRMHWTRISSLLNYDKVLMLFVTQTLLVEKFIISKVYKRLGKKVEAKPEVMWVNIGKDKLPPKYYLSSEDPAIYASKKTQRGPLKASWIVRYIHLPKQPLRSALSPFICLNFIFGKRSRTPNR